MDGDAPSEGKHCHIKLLFTVLKFIEHSFHINNHQATNFTLLQIEVKNVSCFAFGINCYTGLNTFRISLITYSMQDSSCDASSFDNDFGELSVFVGKNRVGFGGICEFSRLTSNVSTTLVIDGLSDGLV